MRKISLLLAVLSLGLSAKIWVNAIRDPGAELGQGDWTTQIEEYKEGGADSAVVSVHDSTRAYEGNFSFLTDTKKYCGVVDAAVQVRCVQTLSVPKAVKDIDSCFWWVNMEKGDTTTIYTFFFLCKSENHRNLRWEVGESGPSNNDTFFTIKVPTPDSGVWASYSVSLYRSWVDNPGWPVEDTIIEVQLASWGGANVSKWYGQEVSWDNIVLRSVAYYDYAAKSIDSDLPSGGKYTPIVTFANEGIKADKDAYVYVEILEGSARVYVDSQKVSIPKESSKQVTFTEWSVSGAGPFTLRVYPILDLDELSSDDTLEKALGGVNEGEVSIEPLRITQTSTGVEFSFSPGTSGELSVYDACGREVFNRSIVSGTTELRWSTSGIPSGLYFARLRSPTYSSSEKFLVVH